MPFSRRFTRYLAPVLLGVILAAAAGLRFYDLNWDNGIYAHPDERSTVAFYAPTIRWPDNLSTLLDPRASSLNPFWDLTEQKPRSYTYGHFPLYTLVLAAHTLHLLAPLAGSMPFIPPEWIQFMTNAPFGGHGYALIGRALMALADLWTVYLVFLLGRRLYGVWGGLLAAALSTFTVLQIQLAHFFAVDPVSTTFTLLALYGAILLYDRPSKGAAFITGIGIGLAIASKFSALPIAFAPVAAAYFAVMHHQPAAGDSHASTFKVHSPEDAASSISGPRSPVGMFGLVMLTFSIAFLIFALTSPFVLLDFQNFKHAVIDEQGTMVTGVGDWPFTRQYRNTPAYWYFIDQQLRWGLGWPLGLLALAGTLWVILKAIRRKAQPGEWIILWWIILYFGPTGLFLAKFMRYMVPVVPLLTLFGAGLVAALWQWRRGEEAKGRGDEEMQESRNASLSPLWEPPKGGRNAEGQEQESEISPPLPNTPAPLLEKLTKATAIVLIVLALGGAMFWSLAFVNGVYGGEHTWVTFARWVYANVPDGSCIAWEHWDDRMPIDLPEPNGNPGAHGYYQPQLPMYEEDTPQKYEGLRDTLLNCDYVVLATNRLWRTIPRLPERYPLSVRYYKALFSGELGFEQVHTNETPPRLGPFVIDDQSADESFTVYDHPKPILFKKVRQLSPGEWDALLSNTWQGAIPGYIGPPTLLMRLRGVNETPSAVQPLVSAEHEDKSPRLDTPVDQLPVIDDFHWNSLANNSTLVAVLFWWLVVILIGLLAWPITSWLCSGLPDRGYGLGKSLGLLLVSYFIWLTSSLGWLSNSITTAIVGLVFLAGLSVWVVSVQRRRLLQFWQEQRTLIIITEIVFCLVYLFFICLRILNPDLWQPWLGGEKMLEIGFLNAVVKSAYMPPYDPFFAGEILNYYYYGLFIVGVLTKLTGIQPSIAFNLAVPTLAALTAVNAFSLVGNLSNLKWFYSQTKTLIHNSSRFATIHYSQFIISGLLGVLFVIFIGNLEGAAQLMRELGKLSQSDFQSAIPGLQTFVHALIGLGHTLGGEQLAIYNYWDPTRVIPATINEFPYFSFLFADLHPHMIGLPFTVLFLSLAYNWLCGEAETRGEEGAETREEEEVDGDTRRRGEEEETHHEASKEINAPEQVSPSLAQLSLTSSLAHLTVLSPLPVLARWLFLPFVLGAIAAINTWDLPTYLGLMLVTFLLRRYRQEPGMLTLGRTVMLLSSGALFTGALLGGTYLLYAPFFLNYQAPAETGLGLVYTQTALDQHLKIWGFFLFIIVSWLWLSLLYPATRNDFLRAASLALRRWNVWPHLHEIYRQVVRPHSDIALLIRWGVGLVLIISVVLALLGYHVPAYLIPLVGLSLALQFRREAFAATAYLNLLTFTGLLLLLGVEFFFLRDFLGGGEYYRMNTLFKFYIQVWVMFALVSAAILPRLWLWAENWPLWGQLLGRGVFVLLLLATLIYPVLGTRTRIDDRFPGDFNRPPVGTLDGLAYMTVGTFEWPAGNPIQLRYDYEAIRWLQAHVPGTPIIAEAKVGYYREGGMRVAAYTGLPSILGGLHQNEQHHSWQVGERDAVVNEFWSSPDPARTQQLINQLGISYIYLGQVERITHGVFIEDKFNQLQAQGTLEVVFENEQTKIYKVVR